MAGNAMEWVNDFLGAFQDTSVSNFIGSPDGGAIGMRILKGGSFRSSASNMHIYSRGDVYTVTSSTKADYVGFRLALGPIPDGNSFDAEKPNSSTAKALASSQELKLKVGTTLARLAFRDDEIGKIVVVEYAIGSNSFFEIQTKSEHFPEWAMDCLHDTPRRHFRIQLALCTTVQRCRHQRLPLLANFRR